MNLETVRTRTPWNSVSQLVIRQIVLPVAFKSLFESKSRFSFLQFFFGSLFYMWQIFWTSRVLFVANLLHIFCVLMVGKCRFLRGSYVCSVH